MSVLRNFERGLEGAVEGLFAKTFRSGLQPVELAKRILRDMDGGRTVGADGTVWVPNRYVFRLSPVDAERFGAAERALKQELSQVVRDGAQERRWGLMGPPQIEFETDEHLKKGAFKCEASLAEGPTGEQPIPPAMAELSVLQGDRRTESFALSKPVTVIGRLDECDITLTDAAASRRHTEVRNVGGVFSVADMASTNGTQVNGAPITTHLLQDGDRITIGQTVLEFRRV